VEFNILRRAIATVHIKFSYDPNVIVEFSYSRVILEKEKHLLAPMNLFFEKHAPARFNNSTVNDVTF